MSDRNSSKRGWLANILWPLSSANSKNFSVDLQSSVVTSKRLAESSLSTKPVHIKSASLEGIKQVKDCCYSQNNLHSARKLERLDSVGGSESEPIRFSYPPSRTIDRNNCSDHIMGNKLQKMWLSNGLSPANSAGFKNSDTSTPENDDSPSHSFARVGSYLFSSLQNLSSKIASVGSAKPLNQFHSASTSMHGTPTMHDRAPDKTEKTMDSFPTSCMACLNAQITVSCDTRICSLNCQKMQVMSCIQATLPSSGCAELTLMSPECFNEMQMNSAMKDFLPQDCIKNQTHRVSDVDATSELNHLSENANVGFNCDQVPVFPTSCKNPYIANILGLEPDSESDVSSESSQDSASESCFSSSCEDCSDTEEDEEPLFNSCKSNPSQTSDEVCQINETPDTFSNNDMSSSDDSSSDEESCPWKRILSSRNSWTAKRRRKPKDVDHRKRTTITDLKSASGNHVSPSMHTVSDNGLNDLPFESSVSDEKTVNTVQRPTCNNSSISYILGCSEDGYDSDNEEKRFSCSDSENCWSVEDHLSNDPSTLICDKADSQAEDSNKLITPKSSSDSCELWDYFVKCHSTFLNICSAELNKSTLCDSSRITSSQQEIKETELKRSLSCHINEDKNLFYKPPTKVRFDDKVVVHPMITWDFAYREARKGRWDAFSRDQVRFRQRISRVENTIAWCFLPNHREKVFQSSNLMLV